MLKVENKVPNGACDRLYFSETDKVALDTVAAMLAMALKHARAAKQSHEQRLLIPTLLRGFAETLGKSGPNGDTLIRNAVESCKALLQIQAMLRVVG